MHSIRNQQNALNKKAMDFVIKICVHEVKATSNDPTSWSALQSLVLTNGKFLTLVVYGLNNKSK